MTSKPLPRFSSTNIFMRDAACDSYRIVVHISSLLAAEKDGSGLESEPGKLSKSLRRTYSDPTIARLKSRKEGGSALPLGLLRALKGGISGSDLESSDDEDEEGEEDDDSEDDGNDVQLSVGSGDSSGIGKIIRRMVGCHPALV
jgi:hypothetical protein